MFFYFSTFSVSSDCDLLYTSDGCSMCVSHYADRKCGWLSEGNKCLSYDEYEKSYQGKPFHFGPEAQCSKPAPPVVPPAKPTPVPTPLAQECSMYKDCAECVIHYNDRNCGYNSEKEICESNATKTCDDSKFYYGNNAKCGEKIPTPTPTPWPVYHANTSFCRLLSGTWCSKCVSADPTMNCVWCHDTKECAMGDADGFYFGTCKSYSSTNDDKCRGKSSESVVVGVKVGLAIFISLMIILGVVVCYRTIAKKPEQAQSYENVN